MSCIEKKERNRNCKIINSVNAQECEKLTGSVLPVAIIKIYVQNITT